jgi:hypothetical protein
MRVPDNSSVFFYTKVPKIFNKPKDWDMLLWGGGSASAPHIFHASGYHHLFTKVKVFCNRIFTSAQY